METKATPIWTSINLGGLLRTWSADVGPNTPPDILSGHYELYLWMAFFKIDGDTLVVTLPHNDLVFSSTSGGSPACTFVARPGNHGDLPSSGSALVSIPTKLGFFRTLINPIPVRVDPFDTEINGYVGCVALLWLRKDTPDDDISKGHDAFNSSLQHAINELLSGLAIPLVDALEMKIGNPVMPADVHSIEKTVKKAVTDAITNALGTGHKILTVVGLEHQDTPIGTAVYLFSGDELASTPPDGIILKNGYPPTGEFKITVRELLRDWAQYAEYQAYSVSFSFFGGAVADPYPLSLRRILSRIGVASAREAIQLSTPGSQSYSLRKWMESGLV